MRLCNVASIFAVRPFDHSSLSALLRKVSITIKCKPLADTCELIAYRALFFSRWQLAQAHAGAAAVLVDEFETSLFENEEFGFVLPKPTAIGTFSD